MKNKKIIYAIIIAVVIAGIVAACLLLGKDEQKDNSNVGTSGDINVSTDNNVDTELNNDSEAVNNDDNGELVTRDPSVVVEVTPDFFYDSIWEENDKTELIDTNIKKTEYGGYILSCPYAVYDEKTNIAYVELNVEANKASNILAYDNEQMVYSFGVANELIVGGDEGNAYVSTASSYDGTVLKLFYTIMGPVDKFTGTLHFYEESSGERVAGLDIAGTCKNSFSQNGVTVSDIGAIYEVQLSSEELASLENDPEGTAALAIIDKYSTVREITINGQNVNLDNISVSSAATFKNDKFIVIYVFQEPIDVTTVTEAK